MHIVGMQFDFSAQASNKFNTVSNQTCPQPETTHRSAIQTGVRNLKEELSIFESELDFYIKLIKTHLDQSTAPRTAELTSLVAILDARQQDCLFLKNTLLTFDKELVKMIECDDLQCDDHFARGHRNLKSDIDKFVAEYKTHKIAIFRYLRNHRIA